jgi:hypothetical protein
MEGKGKHPMTGADLGTTIHTMLTPVQAGGAGGEFCVCLGWEEGRPRDGYATPVSLPTLSKCSRSATFGYTMNTTNPEAEQVTQGFTFL